MTAVRTTMLVLGSLLACPLSGPAVAWEIALSDSLVTRNPVVRLADIAEIRDLDDAELKANLAAIVVTVGPTQTHVRELSNSDVRRLVELRGVDMSQGRFTGAARVTITYGEAAPLTPARTVRRRAVPTAQMYREMERVGYTPATPAGNRPRANSTGTQAAEQPMVVAVRDLNKGRPIQATDVKVVLVAEQQVPPGAVACLEDVVGYEVTRPVLADESLTDQILKKPLLVRSRDLVEVGVCCGGIVVTKQAMAHSDGGRGDMVVISPVDDKKTRLNALVVDVRKVRVLAESLGGTD